MTETSPQVASKTNISWDVGTAYELFISLIVLHEPETYGLRASWAAGVRSRIPPTERKFLEEIIPFLPIPLTWLHRLAAPKDALSVLWGLRQIPAAERIQTLFDIDQWDEPEFKLLPQIAKRGSWTAEELEKLTAVLRARHKSMSKSEPVEKYLDWWAHPVDFGETYLAALQAYHQVFFADEEKRIAPTLQAGLEHAQQLSTTLSLPDLVTELSQGVHIEEIKADETVFIPAYWLTPLLLQAEISENGRNQHVFIFGARPASMSAMPGEHAPEGLIRSLKALADPTRLTIMRYLSKETLTPSELARRLNLRAPTVTHHLNELRLAGLVNLTIKGQEKHYNARREALPSMFRNLEDFLDSSENSNKSA